MKLKSPKNKAIFRRILQQSQPYRGWLIFGIVLAVASVAAQLYIPILTGDAIDGMVGPEKVNFTSIVRLLFWIGASAGLSALAQWGLNACNNHVTYCLSRDLRNKLMSKLQRLPLSFLDAHSAGEIVSRMVADIDTFSDGILMLLTQLFTGVMMIIGIIFFMFSVDALISLVVIVLTPLSLVVASYIAKHSYRYFREQAKDRGDQTAYINEMVEGQKVVQAFGYEARSQEAFDQVNEKLRKSTLKSIFYSSLTNPTTRFVNSTIYACVGLVGALATISGRISVGGLSVFLNYANQYTKPFNEISGVVTELQNALACVDRVFELLDEQEQVPELPDAETLESDGHVTVEHVFFRYTPDRDLIRDFNLDVRPGERVAIVGPTGCGKTTLINLLMRFYDVDSGRITITGRDIRSVTRASLRKSYGMVLQDTWLKTGTVRENIAYGRPDATEEEIVSAAKSAYAHSFIRRLPQGYDTVISEGGENISQGQRQLLCIARVMLCLPPMLILDEATSSIDTRTETKIQNAFAYMMQGRTSFIVAHRLSTIREADLILVMNDGKIVEQGSHDELMEKGGFYAKLYNSQFEGREI